MSRLSLKSIKKYHTAALNERYNALHDALTGLKNRKFMLSHMKENIQANNHFALMLIDLDNFKHINDAFGHLAGDALLKATASRFQTHLSPHAELIRLGGDEFAVILPYRQPQEINLYITQLQDSIKKEFLIRGTVVHVQMSIGIACYPTQSGSITELIKCADLAMYEAKKKNYGFCHYSASCQQSSRQQLQLIDQIRSALDNDEFSLHYQPIFSLATQTVYSIETLLRWQQPDGSFISPSLFIPVAEKAGLITAISRQVIHKALSQLANWQQKGLYTRLQINLSAHDLQDSEITEYLASQLSLFQVDPKLVIIEITESAMMTDIQSAKKVIKAMHKLGLTLCVDDFGAGFTSFTMLSDLPIRQIKIDRQYALEMSWKNNNFEIISSISHLADRIKAKVVIEGIENATQLNKLLPLDNALVQGHHLSQPLCPEQVERYLAAIEQRLAS